MESNNESEVSEINIHNGLSPAALLSMLASGPESDETITIQSANDSNNDNQRYQVRKLSVEEILGHSEANQTSTFIETFHVDDNAEREREVANVLETLSNGDDAVAENVSDGTLFDLGIMDSFTIRPPPRSNASTFSNAVADDNNAQNGATIEAETLASGDSSHTGHSANEVRSGSGLGIVTVLILTSRGSNDEQPESNNQGNASIDLGLADSLTLARSQTRNQSNDGSTRDRIQLISETSVTISIPTNSPSIISAVSLSTEERLAVAPLESNLNRSLTFASQKNDHANETDLFLLGFNDSLTLGSQRQETNREEHTLEVTSETVDSEGTRDADNAGENFESAEVSSASQDSNDEVEFLGIDQAFTSNAAAVRENAASSGNSHSYPAPTQRSERLQGNRVKLSFRSLMNNLLPKVDETNRQDESSLEKVESMTCDVTLCDESASNSNATSSATSSAGEGEIDPRSVSIHSTSSPIASNRFRRFGRRGKRRGYNNNHHQHLSDL